MALPSIKLDVSQRLKDREFRRNFFLAESSAKIAEQIIRLRKRRGLTQAQVAETAGTKQPAVSRAERADYQNWSFSTLRALANALDARLRVTIEAAEDVLWEYRAEEEAQKRAASPLLADEPSSDSGMPRQREYPSITVENPKQEDYFAAGKAKDTKDEARKL
jgi:transcriptional regulator with XRE-family HTH domain